MPVPPDLAPFFDADFLARAEAHATVLRWGGLANLAVEWWVLFALGLGTAGRSLWVRVAAITSRRKTPLLDRVLGTDWLPGLAFGVLVAVLVSAATFPGDLLLDWRYAREVGTSTEAFGHWLRGATLDTARLAFGYGAVGLTLDAVRGRFPRSWWIALGAAGSLVVLVTALLEPYRAHAYHEVTTLPDGPLRTRLEGLLVRHHAATHDFVVIDASSIGPGVNAFATGLGPTRRFVLTDTLLAQGDEAVAGAVLHEIGHRRDERLPLRLALACLGMFAVLRLVDWLLNVARRRGAPSDAVAVPFVIVALAVLQLLASPVSAHLNRDEEREADALELSARTDLPAYAEEVAARAKADLQSPEPHWFDALFDSHPSTAERIRTALGRRTHAR